MKKPIHYSNKKNMTHLDATFFLHFTEFTFQLFESGTTVVRYRTKYSPTSFRNVITLFSQGKNFTAFQYNDESVHKKQRELLVNRGVTSLG